MGQIYADNHPDTFEPACVKENKEGRCLANSYDRYREERLFHAKI